MTGQAAIGSVPIGASPAAGSMDAAAALFFDPARTVISQYANSPVIQALVGSMASWLDPQAKIDLFYELVWDVNTAIGYGLDVWGRIVGVERVLHIPLGGYLGFSEDSAAKPFGTGIFYGLGNLTSNFALSDAAYRKLILAKALSNITDGSIPAINQILINLFGSGGNSYVRDNGDMTMTYVFDGALSPVDLAIVTQSGVLPKPAGVSVTVEQA